MSKIHLLAFPLVIALVAVVRQLLLFVGESYCCYYHDVDDGDDDCEDP